MRTVMMKAEVKVLTVVSVLHAAIGSWVAALTPGPLLVADDLAYLAMARTLAGQGGATLADQPPYGALYPLLLAPGWLLGLDELSMLSWARVLNALFGAATIPLLYFIVRRLTSADRWLSLVSAVVAASLPAHLATASVVWTERLLPLLIALCVLVLLRFLDAPVLGRALLVDAAAVALYATHPRLGLCALLMVLATPFVWPLDHLLRRRIWRRRILRRRDNVGNNRALPLGWVPSACVVFSGLVGLVTVERLRRLLAEATFGNSGIYDLADLGSRRGIGEVPQMALHGVGALSYLALASAGVAVIGVVVLARCVPSGSWVLLGAGGVLLVSAWFLVGGHRADAYLHGRYIEVLAPLLVALGVIGLVQVRAVWVPALMAGSIVFAGFWGAWAVPEDVWLEPRSPLMMLGVEAAGAPFGNAVFEPGAAASVALLVAALMFWAFRRASLCWGLGLLLMVVALGTSSNLATLDALFGDATLSNVQRAIEDLDIDRIALDLDGLSPNLTAAVVWQVGFDNAADYAEFDRAAYQAGSRFSHVLLRADGIAPFDAELVATFDEAYLWSLR
ncbi:MAG: hypothetical protein KTU85_02100 [Acidimicrobiia bacterium]|nr:hypothetical protein [Acidimicrobiia bacterium]